MSGNAFVLDASATLAWAFDEDGFGEVLGGLIRDSTPVVPWLWRLEVTNAILVKERRKILSPADGTRLLGLLDELGVEVVGEPVTRTLAALAELARAHDLSSYDATYLELAIALEAPLLTTDVALRRASIACGVALLWSPPDQSR